jgi:hypothetical protein
MRDLTLMSGRINRRYLQLAVVIITLVMFVIAGGAPSDGGSAGCPSCPN